MASVGTGFAGSNFNFGMMVICHRATIKWMDAQAFLNLDMNWVRWYLLTQVSHSWIKRMTCVRALFSITDKRRLSEKVMILCIREHASIRDHEDYHDF
jgi:hypothetical protein